jgi:hypothetical protein
MVGVERVHVDPLDIDAVSLKHGEQLVAMGVEVLLRAPDLEHVHVVIAIGGVVQAAFWLVDALLLEVPDHPLVIVLRHVVGADVNRDWHEDQTLDRTRRSGITPIR